MRSDPWRVFEDAFQSAVAPKGRRASWPPVVFVEAWAELVEQAVDGYSGDLYEYEAELTVRDDLGRALGAQQLLEFPAWHELKARIAAADARMRVLLEDGPVVRPGGAWWRERLPPHGGEEFAEDAGRLFNVDVEEA